MWAGVLPKRAVFVCVLVFSSSSRSTQCNLVTFMVNLKISSSGLKLLFSSMKSPSDLSQLPPVVAPFASLCPPTDRNISLRLKSENKKSFSSCVFRASSESPRRLLLIVAISFQFSERLLLFRKRY
jgi:hypothetical protein